MPAVTLPDVDYAAFQRNFHRVSVDTWTGPIRHVAKDHGLELPDPAQALSGRNVVLLAGEFVVKFVPPFWRHMWTRECEALRKVEGALSVRTPLLIGNGEMGAWTYLVMDRIPGATLGWRGALGVSSERCAVAHLQGRLAREISALGVGERDVLACDWECLLAEQTDDLEQGLDDLPKRLARSAGDYVTAAGDLAGGDAVVLHGDLMSVNIIPASGKGPAALVDWSDATIGPRDHEFISPLMHQFRGAPDELEHFWSGYGRVTDRAATEHRIMARSLLKYATLMGRYLGDLPGRPPVSWEEAAERFCRIP